MQVEINTL